MKLIDFKKIGKQVDDWEESYNIHVWYGDFTIFYFRRTYFDTMKYISITIFNKYLPTFWIDRSYLKKHTNRKK